MSNYSIVNRTSGMDLGTFEGETADDAVLAMTVAAGYDSRQDLADALGTTVEALDDDLIVTEVA